MANSAISRESTGTGARRANQTGASRSSPASKPSEPVPKRTFRPGTAGRRRRKQWTRPAGGLPRPHECLSINVPITEGEWKPEDLDGNGRPRLRVCPMNTHGLHDKYERRVSPGGDVYYWASGGGLDFRHTGEGTDVEWLWKRAITITPLSFDMTRHDSLQQWRSRLERA